MTPGDRQRLHRRARTQLWLGLVPLLLVGATVLVAVVAELAAARAPLAEATGSAVARVVEGRQPPDGRGVLVEFDEAGRTRTGLLVLAEAIDVQPGAETTVRYVPGASADQPTTVYARGDATSRAAQGLVADLAVVVGLLGLAAGSTAHVALTARRLRRLPLTSMTATRLVVRRGLLVRTWLELDTARGTRWIPVFWSRELSDLPPGGTIGVRGQPSTGRRVLPVIDGAEIWPSGRIRDRAPRGEQRMPAPERGASEIGLVRQGRADAAVVFAAPLLGLLWAYVDASGPGGFAAATVLSGTGLFWLFQLLGSDPEMRARA